MKKFLSLLLALALCAGLSVPALAAEFSDVPGSHVFHDAIQDCAAKGITSGYSDGTFKPANQVTRAQFCVMLSRAFYPEAVTKNSTEANKALGWFVPNTEALAQAGALKDTSFASKYRDAGTMNQPITRYDMARLMTNIMAQKGSTAGEAEKTAAAEKIADWSAIHAEYRDAVANVYALGIIGGYSDGTFTGTNVMNRGQGCVVIYRMAQYMEKSGETPAETPKAPEKTPEKTPDPQPSKPETTPEEADEKTPAETPSNPEPSPAPTETPAPSGTDLQSMRQGVLELVNADAAAFAPLAAAYGLPSVTEAERASKAEVMEKCLRDASAVPLEMMECCCQAILLHRDFAEKGSVIAVSDAGVGVSLCRAALVGASLNVRINTRAMADREYAEDLNRKIDDMLAEYLPIADQVCQGVTERLSKPPKKKG